MRNLKARYRYSVILLKQLIKTDFKLRYQSSFLGYLWSLLRPFALFMILYVVFVDFLHVNYGVEHSAVYLLLGLVVWNYFNEVTTGSVASIVGRGDILRKINFPRYVIVFAGSFSALINLVLNFVVVIVFMIANHVQLHSSLIFFPLLIAELFIFSLALAFFLSTLYVKFRDIGYIWEVIIQAAFYATPIFYPISRIPHKVAKILMLNPMAQLIQDLRYVVVTPQSTTISDVYHKGWIRIIPFGITLIMVFVAAYYFRKRSRYFAEEI